MRLYARSDATSGRGDGSDGHTSHLMLKGTDMDQNLEGRPQRDAQLVSEPSPQRRSLLKMLGGGVIGAAVLAGGLDDRGRAMAAVSPAAGDFEPLWNSALVLIGNSPANQTPSPFIKCPLFFENGHYAEASHTLDLSNLQTTGKVIGTVTYNGDTIAPDFGASIAATTTQGSDGFSYLLVGGEGKVVGGTGYFRTVTKAIIRCKYRVKPGSLLLIRCIDCVVILVRK
jgi:hypothetical protein